MSEAQSLNPTELLFCFGVLIASIAIVACKLKWGNHVQMEERRYRAARRLAVIWAYVLLAGALVLFPLGMLGVSGGHAAGWACLLTASLFILGSRLSSRFAKRRRPRWLEIALDRKRRKGQRPE